MKAQPSLPPSGDKLKSKSACSSQTGAVSPKWRRSLAWKLTGAAIASSICFTAGSALAQVYSVGSRGSAVSDIQQQLGVGVDGVFGPDTEAAVMDFQARSGLAVDGQAGPSTLQALGLYYLIDGNPVNVGGPTYPAYDQSSNFSSNSSSFNNSSNLGNRAIVRTQSGIGVQIRDRPNGNPIGGLDDGTSVYLSGQQQTAGDYTWAELARPNRGWVASSYLVPFSIGGPGGGGQRGPYVVAVPGGDIAQLNQVQRATNCPYINTTNPYIQSDSRGNFINAGSFTNRSAANTLSGCLRNQGFDARVIYR